MPGVAAMAPIHGAAYLGYLEEVKRLIVGNHTLLDLRHEDLASTPLMFASGRGHLAIVRYLLDKGARINERSAIGFTALAFACGKGRLDVASLLLERGATASLTEYVVAVTDGGLDMVHLLLRHWRKDRTASLHQDGRLLHHAICCGRDDMVDLLLEAGADALQRHEGSSLLQIAARKNQSECVELLKVRGMVSPP